MTTTDVYSACQSGVLNECDKNIFAHIIVRAIEWKYSAGNDDPIYNNNLSCAVHGFLLLSCISVQSHTMRVDELSTHFTFYKEDYEYDYKTVHSKLLEVCNSFEFSELLSRYSEDKAMLKLSL